MLLGEISTKCHAGAEPGLKRPGESANSREPMAVTAEMVYLSNGSSTELILFLRRLIVYKRLSLEPSI